jgi:hypothetical protein
MEAAKTSENILKNLITLSTKPFSLFDNNQIKSDISSSQLIHSTPPNNSKLVNSINLLKNIIEKISKSKPDIPKSNQNNLLGPENDFVLGQPEFVKDESGTIDKLYAFAQNSVTLSFKDYFLLQKASRDLTSTYPTTVASSIISAGSVIASNAVTNSIKTQLIRTNSSAISPDNAPNILNMIKSLNKNMSMPHQSSFSIIPDLYSTSNNTNTIVNNNDVGLGMNNHFLANNSSLLLFMALFYSILVFMSLVSNPLLTYILLWRRKSQIKIIDIFVANLSLSDMFLTIFNIPLCLIIYFSEKWPFSRLGCQLGTFSTSCSIYVNIYTMAYISIDRYFAVTRPLHISNPRKKSVLLDDHMRHKIYTALALIWLFSIILSIPQIAFSKLSTRVSASPYDANSILNSLDSGSSAESNDTTGFLSDLNQLDDQLIGGDDPFKQCIIEYPYPNMKNYMVLFNFLLQYLIPSIVILYFYGKIIYHLYLNLNIEDLMEATPMPSKNLTVMTPTHGSKPKSPNMKNGNKKPPM